MKLRLSNPETHNIKHPQTLQLSKQQSKLIFIPTNSSQSLSMGAVPSLSIISFSIDTIAYIFLNILRIFNFLLIVVQFLNISLKILYKNIKFAFFGKSTKSKILSTNVALLHIILLILTFLLINNLYQTAKNINYLTSAKHPPLLISQTDGYLRQDLQVEIIQNIQLANTDMYKPTNSKVPYFIYRVQPGDTLYTIALKYGITTNTLIAANNIRNVNYLKIGQKLKVPARNGILYIAKRGDSFLSLSKKYKVKYDLLLSVNGFTNKDKLKVGQTILIPGVTPTITSRPHTSRPPSSTYLSGSYLNGLSGGCSFALKYSGSGLQNYKVRPQVRYVKFIRYAPVAGPYRLGSGFAGYRWGTYYWHSGIDFIAKYGTPLIAVADGIINRVGVYGGYNYGYGNYVKIYHPQVGLYTLYAHMSRYYPGIRAGVHVRAGQVIGYVGASGIAHGAHVHFEVIDKNRLRYNAFCFK